MDKIYYTVYQVTNKINGKIYIGCHKTRNLDDGYMGSGKYLKFSIEKNGIENFKKEILFVYDSSEEMFAKEAELVNEEFIAESNTYNLKIGGEGGFDRVNMSKLPVDKIAHARLGYVANRTHMTDHDKNVRAGNESFKQKTGIHAEGFDKRTFTGKKHSVETKLKIGEANAKHQSGSGNSHYGMMWIYNIDLKQNKRIEKSEPIPEGWVKGRKMKF